MIILDTNVISEAMRPAPEPNVSRWLDVQSAGALYLTTITIAEVRFGLGVLPRGRRRHALEDGFQRILAEGFQGRLLPFDEPAADEYGGLMSRTRAIGRPMSVLDGQIAAIARAHGFAIATRNARDFEESGVRLLNPFA